LGDDTQRKRCLFTVSLRCSAAGGAAAMVVNRFDQGDDDQGDDDSGYHLRMVRGR
jgi:hypothetical protein